ncbi:cytochrome c biogenesis CcdA family protein [Nocardiopsis rhodophaea]|uniref:Cytochrome c biogenesis CcdA family protein n=1 Tax=Nocardiopsis rhodophaea TaxID=280238 RepID=A0ABN2TGI1_9ACTN
MTDIGFAAALAGGVLALLSPCSALLLPSFFGYAFRDPRRLFARTALFYLGLCVTLVPLGAGSAAVSQLFYGERDLLITIAGWLIIAFGAAQIAGLGIAFGFMQRLEGRFSGRTDAVSVFALGAVYGLAGFCSGPILGAVLTVAATGGAVRGALLLAVYALGMALPLFVLALLWDRFDLGRRGWLRGRLVKIGPVRLHTTSTASGLLFILIGVLFLRYDGTASLFGGALFEDQAYRAQQWLARLSGSGADLVFFGAVGLALVGAGAWRWYRERRAPRSTPEGGAPAASERETAR